MLIRTRCSDCGREYRVGAELDGRRVRCRACGGVFRVASLGSVASVESGVGVGVAGPVKVNVALALILLGYVPSVAYQGYVLVERSGVAGLLPLAIQVCLLLLVAVPLGALGLNWAGKLTGFVPPEPVYLAVLATFAVPAAVLNAGGVLVRMTGMTWWTLVAVGVALPLTYLVLALFNKQGMMRDGVGFVLGVVAPVVMMIAVALIAQSIDGAFI